MGITRLNQDQPWLRPRLKATPDFLPCDNINLGIDRSPLDDFHFVDPCKHIRFHFRVKVK
jgi:hypothetical protein